MYKDSRPVNIDQGVILDSVYFYGLDQSHKGFVLTPACDFAQNKAELVQICALLPATLLVGNLRDTIWSRINLNNLKGNVSNIIKQRYPRYHWLTPLPEVFPALVADFQVITSIPFLELTNSELVAELISPFREQIPARYAAYLGRVGTPDFDKQEIHNWSDAIISGLNLDLKDSP